MRKEAKITQKGAAKKFAEIRRKIREQPISQRMYDFVEAYKKHQLNDNQTQQPRKERINEKSF